MLSLSGLLQYHRQNKEGLKPKSLNTKGEANRRNSKNTIAICKNKMQFCPKCGSVLVKKRKHFACAKCGYTSKEKFEIVTSEKMGEKQIIGFLKEEDSTVWPTITITCSKCGNRLAYFWTAQMRAGDEAETRFFRCTKCKHTWREYA